MNGIAIAFSVTQPFENHSRNRIRWHSSITAVVKRAAVSRWREDLALFGQIALLRELDGGTTGESHLAVARQQRVHGQGGGHQRTRAGSVEGDGGARQVQMVGRPGSDRAVEEMTVAVFHYVNAGRKSVMDIGVSSSAYENANGTRRFVVYLDTSILQGLDGDIKEEPLLLWLRKSIYFRVKEKKKRVYFKYTFLPGDPLQWLPVPKDAITCYRTSPRS